MTALSLTFGNLVGKRQVNLSPQSSPFSNNRAVQEDHEIFDLVSALEGAEGKGTTFYSFLGVPSTATASEITKAFRKRSIQLQ